jgi:Lon protease-like protein
LAEAIDSFPLFPLGLVLLPREAVPLHVFEERYKLMIGECVEHDRPFGIVAMSEAGLAEVGCTARVTNVLERMDDGRMNILVEGERRFRLLRRIDSLPYPAGDVELLDDEPEPEPSAGGAARERYARLVERATDAAPEPEELARLDAYAMAATLDFALEAKQGLLELGSEEARLERLAELFEATIRRLDQAERAAERAQSNGKVRFDRGGGV